ncbi:hypothetical protein IFM89_011672 [Coptis chinensis]|uniref:PHD-type domain-containing protein n=1 Tax=Coptis chinensis TaxID=261450 RepID=A0A835HTC2_9MAGN|nr:hypothetical protein IFM89_011672 [Coptis chinensis]
MTEKTATPKSLSSKKEKIVDTRNSGKKNKKKKGKATSTSESCLPPKSPKKKPNQEKELIRDQIRKMVEDAGWKIEYRPRLYKDYSDAVYIDFAGTVYWSIIRAYNGIKSQWNNGDTDQKHFRDGFSFKPIPVEILEKLTRLTRKRKERDNKMGHKAEKRTKKAKGNSGNVSAENKHDKKSKGSSKDRDKLNHLIRHEGKSQRVRLEKKGLNLKRKVSVRRQTSTCKVDKVGNDMPKSPVVSHTHLLQGGKSKTQRGFTLLVRTSDQDMNSEGDPFFLYPGKRTVLSWLIDTETVPLSGKVKYMNKRRTRAMLDGKITRDGISCGCCSKIVTISEFETHAGSKLHQPCQNIFLENGIPLFQCLIDAWNKQEESERSGFYSIDISSDDPNDDTCGICGDGGDLICCDGCPSTFHQTCLGIQVLPRGDWHCLKCCCKFCKGIGCSSSQRVETAILRLLTCSLCEEKYHGSCLKESSTINVKTDRSFTSFCGKKCRELFAQIQKLLGKKHVLEGGFSWTLLHRSDLKSDTSVSGLSQKAECNSKLALALSVMDECFLPITDQRSGVNLLHNVVYNRGSNFNRLNYSGFYTVTLEKGDEIISVASIRIHGTKFAEMPFVGTRHTYRRQGMWRRLLNAIESCLSSLKVEKLIIPAISELMDTWTLVFGFEPLEELYKHEVRSLNMIVFPGVDLLQKVLLKRSFVGGTSTDGSALKAIEVESDNHITAEVIGNSDTGPDNVATDVAVSHANGIIDEVADANTESQVHGCLVSDTSGASIASDGLSEAMSFFPEEKTACCNLQLGDESSVPKTLAPEADETPTMNSTVKANIQASLQGTAGDTLEQNIEMGDVKSDLHSLAEVCARCSKDVLNIDLDLHAQEEGTECCDSQAHGGSSETKTVLPDGKNEPPKNSCVESSIRDSIEGALDGDRNVNLKNECCGSQSREESSISVIETKALPPDVESEPPNKSFDYCTHNSVEGSPDDPQDVIMTIDCCDSPSQGDPISTTETKIVLLEVENKPLKNPCVESGSPDAEEGGQDVNMIAECRDSHSQDDSISTTETKIVLLDVESEPLKKPCLKSGCPAAVECGLDDALDINMETDAAGSNLNSLAKTSAQHTTDVLNESLDINSPKGETGCYSSQTRDASSICTSETELLTVLENKPTVNSSVEPSLQAPMEGSVGDTEAYMKVNGVKPDLQSLAEISIRRTAGVPDASMNSDYASSYVGSKSKFNSDSSHQNDLLESTDISTKPQVETLILNAQSPGVNVLCGDSEDSNQLLNTLWNSKESLENHDVQLLQKTESACDASDKVNDCEVKIEVVITEDEPKSLDDESVDCISEVVNESVCAVIQYNCKTSVGCRGDDIQPNSCNSSSKVVALRASVHQSTHDVGECIVTRSVELKPRASGEGDGLDS